MVDYFKQELDELMGVNRNSAIDSKNREEHYSNPDVCKYFLVSVCPYDLFPNTKYDLGICPRRHDKFFKTQFLSDNEQDKQRYESKFISETISLFEKHIQSVDLRIKKMKSKMFGNNENKTDIPAEFQEKLDSIDIEVKKLLMSIRKTK